MHGSRLILLLAATTALVSCAPAPIYKADASMIAAAPAQVAAAPDRYRGSEVIWGGRVVGVHNFSDHSEIEMLDFTLDSSQRPQVDQTAGGRFIALMPGYVESMDYPPDTLLTLRGHVEGSRAGKVGEADYTFPVVRVDQSHRWTPEEMRKSRVHFGIGVGVIGGFH